jgi:hypothetical protein
VPPREEPMLSREELLVLHSVSSCGKKPYFAFSAQPLGEE